MPFTEFAQEKFAGISTQGSNSKLKSDILYSRVIKGNEFDVTADLYDWGLFLRLHFP